jgi:hypothetical protein
VTSHHEGGVSSRQIYVIERDGGEIRRLATNDVWDLEPDWGGSAAGS